ncbi:MAG: DsrE family protein [Burkholderiales bacterium]
MLQIAAFLAAASGHLAAADADKNPVGPDKVVYHISDTVQQAQDAFRYIRNHLEVNPKARIVVVTHANGVDFLMKGTADKNGNPYSVPVEDLAFLGVRFEVCDITLRERKLQRSQFVADATFVPSGVAEIVRLQQREGYAYLRP